jgi:hypothetical protein
VCAVETKVHEDRQFTISLLSLHFQQISRTVLYGIVTGHLDFWKLCSYWVPKMLSEEHKKKWAASVLTLLTQYSEQGEGFLSQILTGDRDMGIPLDSRIKAAVHGVVAHLTANEAQIQADHFNLQDHVHSFLGQARSFAF